MEWEDIGGGCKKLSSQGLAHFRQYYNSNSEEAKIVYANLEPAEFTDKELWFAWVENSRICTSPATCSRKSGVYYNYHYRVAHLVGSQSISARGCSKAWFRNTEREAVNGLAEEIDKQISKLNNQATVLQALYGACRRW